MRMKLLPVEGYAFDDDRMKCDGSVPQVICECFQESSFCNVSLNPYRHLCTRVGTVEQAILPGTVQRLIILVRIVPGLVRSNAKLLRPICAFDSELGSTVLGAEASVKAAKNQRQNLR